MKKTEIVPFGKYKGQPIEVLAQDHEYLDWLMTQDWFRSRFQNIYNVIINNFQEPTETPEHNILQAKFLDPDYRFKVVYFITNENKRNDLCFNTDVFFEKEGMDVVVKIKIWVDSEIFENGRWLPFGRGKVDYKIYFEIKSQIGDDYPAVMRQITNSKAYKRWENGDDSHYGAKFCLFIDRYDGSVSKEDLVKFFKTAHIKVLFVKDIEEYKIEKYKIEHSKKINEKNNHRHR